MNLKKLKINDFSETLRYNDKNSNKMKMKFSKKLQDKQKEKSLESKQKFKNPNFKT